MLVHGVEILFVAHDPGAKNHLGPLHQIAVEQGYGTRFIDLSDQTRMYDEAGIDDVLEADGVVLVVAGCSTNQAEWAWISAAQRSGRRSAMMVSASSCCVRGV